MRILGSLFLEYRSILLNKVSNEIIVNFSKEMINHLMKIEYSIFKTNSETVLNSFNKSLMGIERLNRFVIGNVMSNLIEISIISGMIFGMLGPKYFINTICIYGLYMYVTKRMSKYRGKILDEKYQFEIKSENKLFDIIYNIDNIKYFQQENSESQKFSNIIKDVRSKDVKVVYSLALLNNCQNFIISTGMVVNLVMGVLDCLNGTLTPGDIVMMQAIFLQIMLPLNYMGMLMREVDETKVNLQYAVEMIQKKESYLKDNKNKESQMFYFNGGKIELKNVYFGFPNLVNANINVNKVNKSDLDLGKNTNGKEVQKAEVDDKKFEAALNDKEDKDYIRNIKEEAYAEKHHNTKLILKNCNAVFEKNTVNAIIGHSGNGKSTIFNLIYNLYEPNSGKILVDNQDISSMDIDSYRKVFFFS
jgi:ABC-type transport system involved in Fe-S cluster assembly fused permease/ATPase subunit